MPDKRKKFKYSTTFYRKLKLRKQSGPNYSANLASGVCSSRESVEDPIAVRGNFDDDGSSSSTSSGSGSKGPVGNFDQNSDHEFPQIPDSNSETENEFDQHSFGDSDNELPNDFGKWSEDLRECIRSWAIKYRITHQALNSLLSDLNGALESLFQVCNLTSLTTCLPKDSRTLLGTTKMVQIQTMGAGQFWYNGIKQCLKDMLSNIKNIPSSIKINFNIDGLPLNSSSKSQFWPILVNIGNYPDVSPGVVAIYYGCEKPPSVRNFLQTFVAEMNTILAEQGILINGQKINVKINAFICDTPARCYLKCVVSHNAYYSCLKCCVQGTYDKAGRHMSFPQVDCELRTDEDFRNRKDPVHHLINRETEEFIKSPLEDLPINMVKDIPIADSLHLLELGIMKRCLKGWVHGSHNFKLKFFMPQIDAISKSLISFNISMPTEIHRAVRGLDSLAFWKASEYRTFLLYLGPVILKGNLNSELYNHFLLLFCAVTICTTNYYVKNKNLLVLANNLFNDYIEGFITNYGIDSISSNVHNLCHVVEDVKRFGSLAEISSYPFENKLGILKRMLRSGNRPLAQVAKRMSENGNLKKYTTEQSKHIQKDVIFDNQIPKPDYCSKTYKTLIFRGITFRANKKDQWLLTKNDCIIKVLSSYHHNNQHYVYGEILKKINSLFTEPFNSKFLNVYCTDLLEFNNISSTNTNDIKCKLVSIKYGNIFHFFPLLHTLDLFDTD